MSDSGSGQGASFSYQKGVWLSKGQGSRSEKYQKWTEDRTKCQVGYHRLHRQTNRQAGRQADKCTFHALTHVRTHTHAQSLCPNDSSGWTARSTAAWSSWWYVSLSLFLSLSPLQVQRLDRQKHSVRCVLV